MSIDIDKINSFIEDDDNDNDNDVDDINIDDSLDDIEIETDESETDIEDINETSETKIVSMHKQTDKHSLEYDTIFRGKKEELDMESDTSTTYYNDNFTHDASTSYYQDTISNYDSIRESELKKRVYDVLIEYTDINFMNNRRKPSKGDFNDYYGLLKIHLKEDSFTDTEMFIELAYYFSDNLFNMFKLLDNKYRDSVIGELQQHIGKTPDNSKDVTPKNLIMGAEVEFYTNDDIGDNEIIVTGVIKGLNQDKHTYIIDSYESIHEVVIDDIIKILNNNKFKYNMNKLNNIDFL